MAIFQGLLFLVFGIGLLVVDYQSLTKGVLPCGPNGVRGRLEFSRAAEPARFRMMFVGYGCAGVLLTWFALRLLFGFAAPLPLS